LELSHVCLVYKAYRFVNKADKVNREVVIYIQHQLSAG